MKRGTLVAIVAIAGGAVAFAMAVRGDRRGERSLDPVESARAQAMADRNAAMTAAAERDRQATAAARQDADDALAQQIAGDRPGQLGAALQIVRFGSLGAMAAPAPLEQARDALRTAGVDFVIDAPHGRVEVAVPLSVARAVREAWGAPGANGAWDDAAERLEARIDDQRNLARITWTSYETLAHELATDPIAGATPFSAVGARLADLRLADAQIDPTTSAGEAGDTFDWRLPPAHGTPVATFAELHVAGGVITSVSLTFDGDPRAALDALHAAYGEPAAGPWHSGKLAIAVEQSLDGAKVTATLAK